MSNSDNVIPFKRKELEYKKGTVDTVCAVAGQILEDVLIVGMAKDGTVKMMTTQEDVADILFYRESAKYAMMSEGLAYPDEPDDA